MLLVLSPLRGVSCSPSARPLQAGTRVAVDKLSTTKKYKVSDVELLDQRNERPIPRSDGFYEMVTVEKGAISTRAQLEAEVANMAGSGMFQSVEADTVANQDGTIKVGGMGGEGEEEGT